MESGRLGVIRLFSESQAGTEHPGWVDLLRAASTALSKIQPTVVSDYLTGLKHIFSHSSSWTKQAEKIVTETARDIPLENLVAIYNRVRSGEYFSKELKTGLLVTVLDRINSSTRGCVKEELRAIRECAELPEFNSKIVSNVLSIEKMVAAKRFGSVLTVRELRALLGECALTQSSPERVPRGAIEHGEAPPAQSGSVTIADSLAVLTAATSQH